MSELQHYGVKGMKWGVRRARKKAIKEDPSRSRFSTGKHYDEVYKALQKDKKPLNDKYAPHYLKLVEGVTTARTPNERKRLMDDNAKLNANYYKEAKALVDKYVNRFNEATLKDIGYADVRKGEAYLKKRGYHIFDVDL